MSAPHAAAGPGLSLRAALCVWHRNLAVYKHTYKQNILPNFFEPVFYLFSMGIGLGARMGDLEGVPYLAWIAPGLIASQAMMGASFEVTWNCFVKAHFGKTYDAFLTTPVTIQEIVIGEILWAVTRACLYAGAFVIVMALFGLVRSPWAVLAVPVVLLVGTLFAALGILYTAMIRYIDFYSYYYSLFVSPMFLFSGVFYPVSSLPGWLQATVKVLPMYHAVELLRGLVLGHLAWSLIGHAAVLVATTVPLVVLAVRVFGRRMLK
jgi:lipooligosaccharide transport system permease protein